MYKIKMIETTEPLNSKSGQPWFRYILSNELNTITGYRPGSKQDVYRFAQKCVTSLNRKYPPIKARRLNRVQANISYLSLITREMHRE